MSNDANGIRIKAPPVKTQGIKTKLVAFILGNIDWDQSGRWVEPFVGSGVVALNLRPRRALLADTNQHIISLYKAIQSGDVDQYNLRSYLEYEGKKLSQAGETHYYAIRERFNSDHSPFDFVFLSRACFNGMMRFNSKGGFNVPFCRKPDRFSRAYVTKICNQVAWVKKQLRGREWDFVAQDWRETMKEAKDGDFVYIDPPYNARHTDYYNRWTDEEADELAFTIKKLTAGFAYSTWKENKYRKNHHLGAHFSDYPITTFEHFYHVGPTEDLRNSMEEALVIAPGFAAIDAGDSLLSGMRRQYELRITS